RDGKRYAAALGARAAKAPLLTRAKMAFMLVESSAEVMPTAARRNEEVVWRRGRGEHGGQGLRAGIADGRRGQPRLAVVVVGVAAIAQHRARDAAAEALA